ncbi:hypothetical protein E4T38_05995 [Aureobasidium subglaciale]|nr:hypothetical protein E4T38_05995 [Aureobasidium subglaciale]KAI5220563.1 hypothetical protein E4T40_05926 [Aureobasidium subglaciale]KAI5224276.1 hypothetical protein E4T41_05856 [Aureobasidium subglaciale]KAI5260700.1 hypothetical protein E4T46_05668 [Aureobasidium subglaciale]
MGLLLAGAAIAAPTKGGCDGGDKAAYTHSGGFRCTHYDTTTLRSRNAARVKQNYSWADGRLETTNITSVSGTFTVPAITSSSTTDNPRIGRGAAIWLGIGGHIKDLNCSLIQAGVGSDIRDGRTSHSAAVEWLPGVAISQPMNLSAGDSVIISVTVTSKNSGTVFFENKTKGTNFTHNFANETTPVCGPEAYWILESYFKSDGIEKWHVPLVNFDTISFTNTSVTTSGGIITDNSRIETFEIFDSKNKLLADTTINASSITVSYRGKERGLRDDKITRTEQNTKTVRDEAVAD